jgi:hypothetical protein
MGKSIHFDQVATDWIPHRLRIPAKADSRSGHGGQPRSEAT